MQLHPDDLDPSMGAKTGWAFLFPGQGSQSVGMGRALAEVVPEAAAVFQEADDCLGEPISRLCFEGPADLLNQTINTQPAILTAGIAALRALEAAGMARPILVAGHSLGEYSALVAAGSLAFADAVRLVRRRGELMEAAVPAGVGCMAVLLGLDESKVREVCVQASHEASAMVQPANFNCPGQIAISGHSAAVERAMELGLAAGASKAIRLPVSGPFHSALMGPAGDALRDELAQVRIQDPNVPVVANVTARPVTTAQEVFDALAAQVSAPVLWEASLRWMLEQPVRSFLEVGPGRVLSGMLKRVDRSSDTLNVEGPQDLEKVLARQKGDGVR